LGYESPGICVFDPVMAKEEEEEEVSRASGMFILDALSFVGCFDVLKAMQKAEKARKTTLYKPQFQILVRKYPLSRSI
jgi:hypothetical protein